MSDRVNRKKESQFISVCLSLFYGNKRERRNIDRREHSLWLVREGPDTVLSFLIHTFIYCASKMYPRFCEHSVIDCRGRCREERKVLREQ